MKPFYAKIVRWTLAYYWVTIILALILVGAALYISRGLQFKGDFIDLLPSGSPSVQGVDEIKKRMGGEGYLVIVLETVEIDRAKQFAEALVPKLKELKEVNYIDYKFDKAFFENKTLLYVDKEDLQTLQTRLQKKIDYEKKHRNPFYIDLLDEKYEFSVEDIKDKYIKGKGNLNEYYITENPSRLIILVKPAGFASDLNFCKRLLKNTQGIIATLNPVQFDPSMKIKYTGRYITRIEEVEFLFDDLKITSLFAIVGVFLLLFIVARQLSVLALIGIPLLSSIAYSLASATLTVGYLNMVTTVLVGILTGMGIDYGIHLYWRYLEERRKGVSIEDALAIIWEKTFIPAFFSALTTAVAFYALMPSKFSGFSQFGQISGTGILICLMTTYLFLPALLVFREKIYPIKPLLGGASSPSQLFSKKYPKPYLTVALFSLFGIYSLVGLFNVEFDYDFRKFSADKHGTLALQEEISESFGVALTPTVVYTDHPDDLIPLTENLHAFRDRMAGKKLTGAVRRDPESKSTIHKGLSIFSYVPPHQEEKIPEIRKLGEIAQDKSLRLLEGEEADKIEKIRRWAEVGSFGVQDLPVSLKQQFNAVGEYKGSFLFIFPAIDLWNGRDVVRFANEIKLFLRENVKNHLLVASEALIFSEILDLVKKEGPQAFLLSFLAILILLFIEFRRVRDVFITLLPLGISVLFMVGIMHPFGVKLNFMNCIIFPVLLGLNIDNSIRILHRYHEMGPGSLRFVVLNTGVAVFLSVGTSVIGFGGLMLAYHKGLHSIGLLASIGMGFSLLASLTFLPAMLQILENRRERKKTTLASNITEKELNKIAS